MKPESHIEVFNEKILIVMDLGVRGDLLKECKSCAFDFFSRTHALRETQTFPYYTRYDCRGKRSA